MTFISFLCIDSPGLADDDDEAHAHHHQQDRAGQGNR